MEEENIRKRPGYWIALVCVSLIFLWATAKDNEAKERLEKSKQITHVVMN